MTTEQAKANYSDLVVKTDQKFAEIEQRQSANMQCGRGCHACCAPGLTVSTIEADHVANFLRANPDRHKACLDNEQANPFADQRCSFLSAEGACLIYEARPLVCRSHGVPLRFPEANVDHQTEQASQVPIEEDSEISVCSLNFTELAPADIPDSDVINLKLLYTLLGLINSQYDANRAERRYLLQASYLVKDTPHA